MLRKYQLVADSRSDRSLWLKSLRSEIVKFNVTSTSVPYYSMLKYDKAPQSTKPSYEVLLVYLGRNPLADYEGILSKIVNSLREDKWQCRLILPSMTTVNAKLEEAMVSASFS